MYSTHGRLALPQHHQLDRDDSGIPDYVEEIAGQLVLVSQIFTDQLGFIHPLQQPRFRHHARTIDIHFIPLRVNGAASDVVDRENHALVMKLSVDLIDKTLTPLHEFFHLIQYGYTMFNNRWSMEGQGRWAEYLLKEGSGPEAPLPTSQKQLDALLNSIYGAESFWNRLATVAGDGVEIVSLGQYRHLSPPWLNLEEISLQGVGVMRRVLEQYQKQDQLLSQHYCRGRYSWTERQQKAFSNNSLLLRAIIDSLDGVELDLGELHRFKRVVEQHLAQQEKDEQSADMTARLEKIGNPLRNIYIDEIYPRNVWDMQTYGGEIYFGGGNSSNRLPAANAGPVPLVRYDPKRARFLISAAVAEEQIDNFALLDGELYIPGHDATQSWDFGNFYRLQGEEWIQYRNIRKGLHNYAMESFNGVLWSALGTTHGASVAHSADRGEHWEIVHLGKYRAYGFLKFPQRLFVTKPFPGYQKRKQLLDEGEDYHAVYELLNSDTVAFHPREELTSSRMFPSPSLYYSRDKKIIKPTPFGSSLLYIGAYTHNDHQALPFGLYHATMSGGELRVEEVTLPDNYRPWDLLRLEGRIYLLLASEDRHGFTVKVLDSADHSPLQWHKLLQFRSPAFARSFEMLEGDLYFALGTTVGDTQSCQPGVLSTNTGDVYRIKGVVPRG
ncbi:MAG: hypothetical protein HQL48_00760 [Gammaproteobacteria bacterium]|nr:hypothetical protein [Gammaproteobacteria bacterium]